MNIYFCLFLLIKLFNIVFLSDNFDIFLIIHIQFYIWKKKKMIFCSFYKTTKPYFIFFLDISYINLYIIAYKYFYEIVHEHTAILSSQCATWGVPVISDIYFVSFTMKGGASLEHQALNENLFIFTDTFANQMYSHLFLMPTHKNTKTRRI